ncbi:MAG: TMEM165/GDT1 family protein [Actinobacteria bacterium]|nr:TMEM165/GDT1 family protein [Actinomycetota bacterium]MCA1721392.1 TMEM165/GDT1 family protein [Actinomycetota bacterium]
MSETFDHGSALPVEGVPRLRSGPVPEESVHPTTVATVFVVIFLAELPDKSLLATLVLGTRYPARWVWAGVSAAFCVHVAIACLAGRLLSLAPRRVVEVIVAVLFAVGAYLLLKPEREPESELTTFPEPRLWPVLATSFGLVFIGEWGDITQLATANFVARYDDALSVGVGAALGLITVAGVAVTAGSRLIRCVPLALVRRSAGLLLAVFAVLALVSAVR